MRAQTAYIFVGLLIFAANAFGQYGICSHPNCATIEVGSSSSSSGTYGGFQRTITHIDPQHTKCSFFGGCKPDPGYHWVKRNGEWWVERLPQQDFNRVMAYHAILDADNAIKHHEYSRAIDLLNNAPTGTSNDGYLRERLAIAWNNWGVEAARAGNLQLALQRHQRAVEYSSDPIYKENLDGIVTDIQQTQDRASLDALQASVRSAARAKLNDVVILSSKLNFVTDAGAGSPAAATKALDQAYSAQHTGSAAGDDSGSFTGDIMKPWDSAGPKVNAAPPVVNPASGSAVLTEPPAALKADPAAWAKYQQLQIHHQALKEESQKLKTQLATIRQQQAIGQGDLAKLAIEGAKLENEITVNTSAIQTDTIHMMDLSFSFDESKSAPKSPPAPVSKDQHR